VESVVDFVPGEDSVDLVPLGLEVLSDDAGDLVLDGASIAGEAPPDGVVSLFPPSQAARPVMVPTSSRAISFDFTLQILTTFNFQLLSYLRACFLDHSSSKGLTRNFRSLKSELAIASSELP